MSSIWCFLGGIDDGELEVIVGFPEWMEMDHKQWNGHSKADSRSQILDVEKLD